MAHDGAGCHGSTLGDGPSPCNDSIFSKTGMTAPVFRENGRCPMAIRIQEIAPECEVREMNVFSSWETISTRRRLMRKTWAEIDSRRSGTQRGSSSENSDSRL